MRIATWNCNSIRSRAERAIGVLRRHDLDVLALQETKCKDAQFPLAPFEEAGYEVAFHGLNQWNGVAIVSRVGLEDVQIGFEGMPQWGEPDSVAEARAIGATCGGVRLWSLYVPNGRSLEDPHYAYKLDWLASLRDTAAGWLADDPQAQICLMGDEPTGNLDSAATDLVLNLLADQHERGVTVVVVTHEPDVAAWAHRRVHVLDGHIDADDGPSAAHDPSHAGTAIRDVTARPLDPRPRSSSAPGRSACQKFPGGEPPRRGSPRDDAGHDA